MITQAGRNALLQINFAQRPIVSNWYIGLFTGPGVEFVSYSGFRPVWTPVGYYNEQILGSTLTPLVVIGDATIAGIALHNTHTKGSLIDLQGAYTALITPFAITTGQKISVIFTVGWA